jgi:replicative DNA helicase
MTFTELDIAVLKVILDNKKYALEFSSECEERVFTNDLWRFGKLVIDYIKVYKEVPTRKVLKDVYAKNNDSLGKYIDQTCDEIDKSALNDREFKHNLNLLKERYAKSLIEGLRGEDLSSTDVKKSIQSIQNVVERVRGLYKNKVYDQKTLKDSIPEFQTRLRAKITDPNFGRGILTGYNFIDYQTNGLRPAELFLVAGESGSGKSMLLMNMAIQMWLQSNKPEFIPKTMKGNPAYVPAEYKKGCNVLYFSLEMPYEQCLNRVLSRVADVPYKSIRDGTVREDNFAKLQQGLKFVKDYPFEFEIVDIPRGATAEQLELIFNDTKLKFTPDVVVVDYLGLMEYEGEMDDWLKLGKISEKLHEFARIFNVCVLSAVQLNRMAKSKDAGQEAIGQHRIGRSALIIQNANIAMQIEKRLDEGMHNDMLVHFIKNRDGEMVKGRLLKNFANCALLNDYGADIVGNDNSEDISDRLKQLGEV